MSKMSTMHSHDAGFGLLRRLAKDTFERLLLSHQLDCSQSEETITDINLLDLKRAKLGFLKVVTVDKPREGKEGFDWEFWIGSHQNGWWRYSCQAKKLDLKINKYKSLRHRVKKTGKYQIEVLEDFSKRNNSIPIYCFYNYVNKSKISSFWHCNLDPEAEQFGCSVVPLHIVKEAHKARKKKSFEALHSDHSAKPWQCLLCPEILSSPKSYNGNPFTINGEDTQAIKFTELPQFLRALDGVEDVVSLPENYYASELGGYPKRIMVIDTGTQVGLNNST